MSTSGGAIRSATWTTRVFVQLDKNLPGFHRHVRLITGASGGMVGAAYCVAELADVEEGLARSIGERGAEQHWVRETFQRNVAQMEALKKLMR